MRPPDAPCVPPTGVEYIHHFRVVHRDLKPENLLLDRTHAMRLARRSQGTFFNCICESYCSLLCLVTMMGGYFFLHLILLLRGGAFLLRCIHTRMGARIFPLK